jgi:hypothetical protein
MGETLTAPAGPDASSEARTLAAEQSVSSRFTRVMNATTSRWGMLTDPSIIGAATAPLAVGLLAAVRADASPEVITALEVAAVLPLAIALTVWMALLGARARVVSWLSSVPFPVENMNGVLNGLGEVLEITFREWAPETRELNAALDRVSVECFVTRGTGDDDAKAPAKEAGGAPPVVEVRIGIVDSTRNPSVSNHRRFERVRALVGEVLVPLGERYPIVEVRVK